MNRNRNQNRSRNQNRNQKEAINNLNLKLAAGTLSPQDLQDLSQWLNPNYDPDEDFIPQATQEEMEQMSMGNRPTPLPPSDPDSTTF